MSENVNDMREALASLLASDEGRAMLASLVPSSRPSRGVTTSRVAIATTLRRVDTFAPSRAHEAIDEASPLVALTHEAHEDLASSLLVEVRTSEGGEVRMRMRCACSRSSYLALASDEDTLPPSIVEALARHASRVRGRALRIMRTSPSLASLATLAPSHVIEETMRNDEARGEGREVSRVASRRGAMTHLTRDALTTLCARDARELDEVSDDDERATCRTCTSRLASEASTSE